MRVSLWRVRVRRTAGELEQTRTSLLALEPAVAASRATQQQHKELAAEQQRLEVSARARDQRVNALEEEARAARAAAAADREALQAALGSVRDLGAQLDERKRTADVQLAAMRDSLDGVVRRQAAFELQLDVLGAAMRRAGSHAGADTCREIDPLYARALAEARRELRERAEWAHLRSKV